MEGTYGSSLTFGASRKLQCLIGLEKQGFEFFNFDIIFQLKFEFSGIKKHSVLPWQQLGYDPNE